MVEVYEFIERMLLFQLQAWEIREEKHSIVLKQQSGKAETTFHIQTKENLMLMYWLFLQYCVDLTQ